MILVTYKMPGLRIQGVAPASNTWSAQVPIDMGISNQMHVGRQVATVFDSAGRPTVLSMQNKVGIGGLELWYAKCQ